MTFTIDREALQNERVRYVDSLPIEEYLTNIEKAINTCYTEKGFRVVQHGRVIALRATDMDRLSSAFKAGLYLGKYDDMENTDRFLNKMVKAGHSYEPIRGENVLFLYIGVGKPVYDHMVTYTVGRPTRIAGGQRANLPWGFEIPAELKGDTSKFFEAGMSGVEYIIGLTKNTDGEMGKQQIQVARSLLPVGYIMPPFLMEFTEEALVKSVFKQRLWEKGAQGATVDIVSDMLECVKQLDPQKWEMLLDYHGPHIARWEKAMRTLRDKRMTFGELSDAISDSLGHATTFEEHGDLTVKESLEQGLERDSVDVYDFIINHYGKLPLNMWERKQ